MRRLFWAARSQRARHPNRGCGALGQPTPERPPDRPADETSASALDAPLELRQLAPDRARAERVAEDGTDQQRCRNVDDVLEGHAIFTREAGRPHAQRELKQERSIQPPSCGNLETAWCSSSMRR